MQKFFKSEPGLSGLLALTILFSGALMVFRGNTDSLQNAVTRVQSAFFESPVEPAVVAPDEPRKQAIASYLAGKYRVSYDIVRNYVELAWKEAKKHPDVTPELLLAVMQKESSLQGQVESNYGAQGLMQVVRRWHSEKLGEDESLLEPTVNVRVGASILQEYIDKKGDLRKALMKYSGNAKGYADYVLTRTRELHDI